MAEPKVEGFAVEVEIMIKGRKYLVRAKAEKQPQGHSSSDFMFTAKLSFRKMPIEGRAGHDEWNDMFDSDSESSSCSFSSSDASSGSEGGGMGLLVDFIHGKIPFTIRRRPKAPLSGSLSAFIACW